MRAWHVISANATLNVFALGFAEVETKKRKKKTETQMKRIDI